MMTRAIRAAFVFLLIFYTAGACNPSQESQQVSQPPAEQQAPPPVRPPQPAPLSLFVPPMDPSNFSMQAIQDNKKRLESNPDDLEALVMLGDGNFLIQRYETSRGYYERALKLDDSLIMPRLSLSNCFALLQQPDDAVKQLDALLQKETDHPQALFNKGLILFQAKKDSAGAKGAWSRLTEVHPDHSLTKQVQDPLSQL